MTKMIRLMLALGSLLLVAPLALATDCTDPSDCSVPPNNASKAVVIVSIFAGAGLALRGMNGDSGSDDGSGSQDAPGDPGPLEPGTPPPDQSSTPGSGSSPKDNLGALGEDPPTGQ